MSATGAGVGLVLALLVPACGDPDRSCTLADCSSGVTTTLEAPLSRSELDGARLEVCRQDKCAVAVVHISQPESEEAGFEVVCSLQFTQEGQVHCANELVQTASGLQIEITYSASEGLLADGDVFRFRLEDASASVTLAERSEAVSSYALTSPNGAVCGPTCKTARF